MAALCCYSGICVAAGLKRQVLGCDGPSNTPLASYGPREAITVAARPGCSITPPLLALLTFLGPSRVMARWTVDPPPGGGRTEPCEALRPGELMVGPFGQPGSAHLARMGRARRGLGLGSTECKKQNSEKSIPSLSGVCGL